jgi:hypothetical protein
MAKPNQRWRSGLNGLPPGLIISAMQTIRLGTIRASTKGRKRKSQAAAQTAEAALSEEAADPRLVELIRLLARRAARKYFEEQKKAQGKGKVDT